MQQGSEAIYRSLEAQSIKFMIVALTINANESSSVAMKIGNYSIHINFIW